MTKSRLCMSLCLVAVGFAAVAHGQDFRRPDHTAPAATYEEYNTMLSEARWYVEVFRNPVDTIQNDLQVSTTYLRKNTFQMTEFVATGDPGIRAELAKLIVARSQFDPIFTNATLVIARTDFDDRFAAIQSTQILVDCMRLHMKQYPGVARPATEILLARLESPFPGVRLAAINGLALLGNSGAPPEVKAALVAQLASDSGVIVDAAAASLAAVGDKTAVRPLMEKFLNMPEGIDYDISSDDTPEGAIMRSGLQPSTTVINPTRRSIAIAVNRLAGLELRLAGPTLMQRDEVLGQYEILTEWWEANRSSYQ